MKKLLIGALAIGSLAFAAPSLAQGVSIDVPGFHAGVGDRYYDHDWRWRHRHEFGAYNYYGCRDVTITHRDDFGNRVIRTERRCD
jgi:hypothetical protein